SFDLRRNLELPELPPLHLCGRGAAGGCQRVIAGPAQLLLAIAEHETLEKACAALGISRADALKLLRGVAVRLQSEKPEQPPRIDGQRKVYVFSDGAARGNPGPAGAGAVVKS